MVCYHVGFAHKEARIRSLRLLRCAMTFDGGRAQNWAESLRVYAVLYAAGEYGYHPSGRLALRVTSAPLPA